jgi:hypothetical protein
MVNEADPSMRMAFDGRFTEVVDNELLASSGSWNGVPGQEAAWKSQLRVEFHGEDGRLGVLREGPAGGQSTSRAIHRPRRWSDAGMRPCARLPSCATTQ